MGRVPELGTCITLSSWSTASIEEVARATGDTGLRWFQLYVYRDRALTKSLVQRAEKAGLKLLFLQWTLLYDAENRFTLPPYLKLANFSAFQSSNLQTDKQDSGLHLYTQSLIDPTLSWETVDWLRGITSLPIMLKGIVTREDAEEALRHNVQGIIVFNHGARQLDGVPATVSECVHVHWLVWSNAAE